MTKLVVHGGGKIRSIWSDDFDYSQLGTPHVERASHVEPEIVDGVPHWVVDLRKSGGPIVREDEQGQAFLKRDDAIGFEKRWLNEHWLRKVNVEDLHPRSDTDPSGD